MDALPSETSKADQPSYADRAGPVIVVGTGENAISRGTLNVEAAGQRVGARLTIEQAIDRLPRQARASAVWVELDADGGPVMDRLLREVSQDVAVGRFAAVVSATSAILDPVAAALLGQDVELIVDAAEYDRVAALALSSAGFHSDLRIHDRSADNSSERLRQLSDEVSRIASTLSRLSSNLPQASPASGPARDPSEVLDLSAAVVRRVLTARRLRATYFSPDLFADPAWDMMLDLLQAEIAQLRVPVSSLCIAAAVPATTALRWLKLMVARGLFVRRSDPYDGRRVFVELAPETSQALRRYFAEIGAAAVV